MSSTTKRHSRCRSDDTMDDDTDDKDDTKRKSRNLSEKKRRDQFNLLVNELSSMVASGGRKMDKSTVLKSTISFLKNHNEIAVRSRVHEIHEDWKPAFLSNEEFTHLVLEAVDGFIMVFSTSGQIFYASESITSLLGHLPNDVLSMTIYEMACEEEQNCLYSVLVGPESDKGGRNEVSFSCHIRRGGSETSRCFELVHFVGHFRSDADMTQTDSNRYSGYSGEADTRLVFVGTGRLQTPQLLREMSVVDSTKSEFTSRHSLEWKFLFLDHRAPPIIGYLPFELLGTSGYDYYHVDDLDRVVSCHEALMQKGEGTSCYYRFLTKGQQWIWLQTRFYITYHQWNSKPEFIVCTHRVVSYADVVKQSRIGSEAGDILGEASPAPRSGTTSPWMAQSTKTKNHPRSESHPRPESDCTSMSADSPTSRHSHISQQQQQQQQMHQQRQSHIQIQPPVIPQLTTFVEPPQYVAALPVQPVIAGFSSPAVLSPLPPVDSMVMSAAQSQLQSDLQRKHAELQAMIGQQQAELRRVSEQLLMARLGLLPPTQHQHQQPVPAAAVINVSVPYVCSGNVSSTTSTAFLHVPIQPPEVLAQIPHNTVNESTLSLSQHQAQMLFSAPNTNPPQK